MQPSQVNRIGSGNNVLVAKHYCLKVCSVKTLVTTSAITLETISPIALVTTVIKTLETVFADERFQ